MTVPEVLSAPYDVDPLIAAMVSRAFGTTATAPCGTADGGAR
ncbi:hypothetical protein SALCHL_004560 [Streptomyces albus subsp. chlorinus]|nr:hypothetical protein [Streptomyces albus]